MAREKSGFLKTSVPSSRGKHPLVTLHRRAVKQLDFRASSLEGRAPGQTWKRIELVCLKNQFSLAASEKGFLGRWPRRARSKHIDLLFNFVMRGMEIVLHSKNLERSWKACVLQTIQICRQSTWRLKVEIMT